MPVLPFCSGYRMTAWKRSSLLLPMLAAVSPAFGLEPPLRRWSLFHPVPEALMRDLSADRPDTTESPVTVDAGHFQIESSFFDFGRSRSPEGRADTLTWGSINLKAGLLPNTDLQIVFDPWVEQRLSGPGGVRETISDAGDPVLRLKVNLFGNNGGRTALAVMPFVGIPTGSQVSAGEWQGGITVPFSVELAERVSLGLMVELDWVADDGGGGTHQEWVHTAVLGFGLTEKLGFYLEYAGTAGPEDEFDYQAACSGGFTWAASDNVQWDIGGRIGLNSAAEECGLFTGITRRF
ncbi:MAG: transporter [Verrucomicrobiaceae bacterium]|nr:MAG: transporter [Verrucomicrobiaceae bacterium]